MGKDAERASARGTRWGPTAVLAWLLPGLALAVGSGEDLLPDIPPGGVAVRLHELVDVGEAVTEIANAGDGSGRLFIGSPSGVIRILESGELRETPFLTIAGTFPPVRGLTGIAFHPDYESTGRLYVLIGEPSSGAAHYDPPQDDTASAFDNVLLEYRVDASDPNRVDAATRRELLRIHQAHEFHNMDDLVFGGDGYLYIAVGDGGETRTGTPTQHQTTAQQTSNPYGSILRIDVDRVGENGRFGVPADNPFPVGAGGNVPEICAWGVRAPWRVSADRSTGEIYAGSNGDFTIESILRVECGRNYGWAIKEGSFLWDPVTGNASVDPSPDPQFSPPLAEYDHNGTTAAWGSVIGGFVYRGARIPELRGRYVFLDWVAGELAFADAGTGELGRITVQPNGPQVEATQDITWGEDERGELYIGRRTGLVLSLRPLSGPAPVPAIHAWGFGLLGALLAAWLAYRRATPAPP